VTTTQKAKITLQDEPGLGDTNQDELNAAFCTDADHMDELFQPQDGNLGVFDAALGNDDQQLDFDPHNDDLVQHAAASISILNPIVCAAVHERERERESVCVWGAVVDRLGAVVDVVSGSGRLLRARQGECAAGGRSRRAGGC
jgi:hypothetical protein